MCYVNGDWIGTTCIVRLRVSLGVCRGPFEQRKGSQKNLEYAVRTVRQFCHGPRLRSGRARGSPSRKANTQRRCGVVLFICVTSKRVPRQLRTDIIKDMVLCTLASAACGMSPFMSILRPVTNYLSCCGYNKLREKFWGKVLGKKSERY